MTNNLDRARRPGGRAVSSGTAMKVIGRVIAHRRVKALARGFAEPRMKCDTSAERAPRRAVAQSLPAPSDQTRMTTCVCACHRVTRTDGRRKRTNTEHTRGPESNANK